jgi:hypothetical protein
MHLQPPPAPYRQVDDEMQNRINSSENIPVPGMDLLSRMAANLGETAERAY